MRRFDRPTLLLWGRQDTNFGPALAERLAGDIPGVVDVIYLERSAHMPFQEEPDRYAEEVRAFLAADEDALRVRQVAFRSNQNRRREG
jgi:pimeloyl-ACP methyl ester carboxylesterase